MITDDVIEYIESELVPFSPIKVDLIGENDSIALRQLPSDAVVTRYMDGSRTSNFDFEMYAKSKDAEKAIRQLRDIQTVLDFNQKKIRINNKTSIIVEPIDDVKFVASNDDEYFIYSATFNLEYFIER